MCTKRLLFAICLSIGFGAFAFAPPAAASVAISVSYFHGELAPYGEWVTVGSYGTCWRPRHVAAGWQPYLYGEWVYTDDGWTWVSYDPWGPDPWHYGTWVFTSDFGWVWIPGTVWAPAWVTWYVADDYCGWAPVPPSFVVGVSGYVGPAVTVSRSAYVFVPTAQLAGVDVRTVRVPATQNAALASRARPVTRFPVSGGVLTNAGPPVATVERVRGSRIPRASLAQAKAKPLPVSAAPAHGRLSVVAPAPERARLITTGRTAAGGAPAPSAGRRVDRSAPAVEHPQHQRRAETVTRREPSATSLKPKHELARPAPPVKEAAPPPPRHVEKAAPPRHVEPPHALSAERHAPPPPPRGESARAPSGPPRAPAAAAPHPNAPPHPNPPPKEGGPSRERGKGNEKEKG